MCEAPSNFSALVRWSPWSSASLASSISFLPRQYSSFREVVKRSIADFSCCSSKEVIPLFSMVADSLKRSAASLNVFIAAEYSPALLRFSADSSLGKGGIIGCKDAPAPGSEVESSGSFIELPGLVVGKLSMCGSGLFDVAPCFHVVGVFSENRDYLRVFVFD